MTAPVRTDGDGALRQQTAPDTIRLPSSGKLGALKSLINQERRYWRTLECALLLRGQPGSSKSHLHRCEFFGERQLRAREAGKIVHHQHILHVRVDHLPKLRRIWFRDGRERVGECAPELRVGGHGTRLDLLDVGLHLLDGLEQLTHTPVHRVDLGVERHELLRPLLAHHRRAHDVVDADALGLGLGNAQPHVLERAGDVLAAEAELGADESLRLHTHRRE
mmetsp:Transcript_8686/g.22477  ORF Transcript_8686/g.22477 Transcript_8686/m.22477 type:complete len:221 (-) Transcript_8686:462-1124(-)